MIREVAGEALALLGGGRAVLMQLAHPLIAAGVAEHGSFQQDPLGRLLGTLRFVHTIVFGTRAEAEAATDWLHELHVQVRGRLEAATSAYPAGIRYHANNPELALWVFATLIDSSLDSFQHFVRPLSPAERRRYYQQTQVLARLLELPNGIVPPNLQAFDAYLSHMLNQGPIEVTAQARSLAQHVLRPGLGGFPGLSAALLRFVTAGTIDQGLRRAYGLSWSRSSQLALEALGRTTRTLRPFAPRWLWQSPLLGPGLARLLLGGLLEDARGLD